MRNMPKKKPAPPFLVTDRCDLPVYTPSQVAAAINAAYKWVGRMPVTDEQSEAAARAKANLGPVLYFLDHVM